VHHHDVAAAGRGNGGDNDQGSDECSSNVHDILLSGAFSGIAVVRCAMSEGSGQGDARY
jgi:hypothetical protein